MADTFECPVCGADVPQTALACPECGADERTGLYDEDGPIYQVEQEEDDTFDYDKFMEKEFGTPRRRTGKEWIIAAVAVALVIVWVVFYVL